MRNNLKTLISAIALITIPSCSHIGYRATTLASCFPEEERETTAQDSISFKQKLMKNTTIQPNKYNFKEDKDKIEFKYKFMDFD